MVPLNYLAAIYYKEARNREAEDVGLFIPNRRFLYTISNLIRRKFDDYC